jgi:putative intracellular protease/amidase
VEGAILLHAGVSAVEALGTFAVLRRVPGAGVRFVAATAGPYATQAPVFELAAIPMSTVVTTDVLVVPGGFGAPYLVNDAAVVDWVRTVAATAQCVGAVSTGRLLLDAAGVDDRVEGDDPVELGLTVARRLADRTVADRIRSEVAGQDVEHWYGEARAAAVTPSRWQRFVQRARHGSLVVDYDDTQARPTPPQVPKGWRGPVPLDGSALDD